MALFHYNMWDLCKAFVNFYPLAVTHESLIYTEVTNGNRSDHW